MNNEKEPIDIDAIMRAAQSQALLVKSRALDPRLTRWLSSDEANMNGRPRPGRGVRNPNARGCL